MEARQGRRVLVLEDEYFIANDLVDALDQAGVVVVGPMATVDEALAAIEQIACDAAILDLNLSGQADFRVADELQRRRVPFVFATGYDADTIPSHHQAVKRFEKPYDAAALAAWLVRMLPAANPASSLEPR